MPDNFSIQFDPARDGIIPIKKSEEAPTTNQYNPIEENKQFYQQTPNVEGIGNQFKNDSRFDIGIQNSDLQDIENYRGENEPAIAKIGAGIVKGSVIAATTAASTFTALPLGIGEAIGTGQFSKVYDNELTNMFDKINKSMEQSVPNYYTNKERNASTFSADNILTANFLGDKLLKNAGFTIGAIGSGSVMAKGIQALGKLAMAGNYANELSKVQGLAANYITQGVEESAAFTKAMKEVGGMIKITDAASKYGSVLVSAANEGSMEALGTKQSTMQKLISNYKEKNGQDTIPTEDELKKMDSYASDAGNIDFAANMAILTGSDLTQFSKFLRGFKDEEHAVSKIATDKIVKEGGQFVSKDVMSILDKLKPFKSTLTEAGEEGSQQFFQTAPADYYSRKYDNDAKGKVTDIISSVNEGLRNTFLTKEGQESMLLGGLTGSISGVATGETRHDWNESKERVENTKLAADRLNAISTTPMFENAVRSNSLNKSIENDVITGDKHQFLNDKFDSLKSYVQSRVESGKEDLIQDELNDLKNFTPDEYNKYAGTEYTDSDKPKIDQRIEELKQQAKSIAEVHSLVEDRFRHYPKEYKERAFDAITNIQDKTKRINDLSNQLNKAGLYDVISAVQDVTKAQESGNQELLNLSIKNLQENINENTTKGSFIASNISNPEEIVSDIIKLSNEKRQNVSTYNTLVNPEFLQKENTKKQIQEEENKTNQVKQNVTTKADQASQVSSNLNDYDQYEEEQSIPLEQLSDSQLQEHINNPEIPEEIKRQLSDILASRQQPTEKNVEKVEATKPIMITKDMHRQLADLGYNKEDRSNLTPEQAHEIINNQSKKPSNINQNNQEEVAVLHQMDNNQLEEFITNPESHPELTSIAKDILKVRLKSTIITHEVTKPYEDGKPINDKPENTADILEETEVYERPKRLNALAINRNEREGKEFNGKITETTNENKNPDYLILDSNSVNVGDEITVKLDTEWNRLNPEDETAYTLNITKDGKTTKVGNVATIKWVSETQNGVAKNIADTEGNHELQIKNITEFRKQLEETFKTQNEVKLVVTNKSNGRLLFDKDYLNRKKGENYVPTTTIKEALPSLKNHPYFKSTGITSPIVIYSGGNFWYSDNNSVAEQHLATSDKFKENLIDGSVLLLIPTSINNKFIPTPVWVDRISEKDANFITDDIKKILASESKGRTGHIRNTLQDFIFLTSLEDFNTTGNKVPKIYVDVQNSIIKYKGTSIEEGINSTTPKEIKLNDKNSINQKLIEFNQFLQLNKLSIKRSKLNDLTVTMSAVKTEGNKENTPYLEHIMDRIKTPLIEWKDSLGNAVYTIHSVVEYDINKAEEKKEYKAEKVEVVVPEVTEEKQKILDRWNEATQDIINTYGIDSTEGKKVLEESNSQYKSELKALETKQPETTKKTLKLNKPSKNVKKANNTVEGEDVSFGFMSEDQLSQMSKDAYKYFVKDGDKIYSQRKQNEVVGIFVSNVIDQFRKDEAEGTKLNVNKAFERVEDDFTTDYENYKEISDNVNTQKDLDTLIDSLGEDFNYLKGIKLDKLKNLVSDFESALKPKVFNQFKIFTVRKLSTIGYKIKEETISHKTTEEQVDEHIDPSEVDDITTEEGGYERTDWSDGASFQLDSRDTASARIKGLLSTIESNEESYFGLRTYLPIDVVFNDLMMYLSELPSFDLGLTSFKNKLEEIATTNPSKTWINQIVDILNSTDVQQSTKNEFVSVFAKHYNNYVMTLISKGGKSPFVGDSNRDTTSKKIIDSWLENQKISKSVILNKEGEYEINTKEATEFKNRLKNIKPGNIEEQKKFVKDLFNFIGIKVDPKAFESLFTPGVYDNKIFKNAKIGASLNQQFAYSSTGKPLGLYSILIDSMIPKVGKVQEDTTDELEVDSSLLKNNPLAGVEGEKLVKWLSDLQTKYVSDVQAGSLRNAEGKQVYAYGLHVYEDMEIDRLKNDVAHRESHKNDLFASGATWLTKGQDFWDNLSYNILDGLRERGSSQRGIRRTDMSRREMELDVITKFQTKSMFYGLTHSDKSTTPIIQADKETIHKFDSQVGIENGHIIITDKYIHPETLNLFNNLVKSEARRILAKNQQTKEELLDKSGDKFYEGMDKFYLFPELNSLIVDEQGKVDYSKVEELANSGTLPKIITKVLTDEVNKTIGNWEEFGLVTRDKNGNLVNNFNSNYLKGLEEKIQNKNERLNEKLIANAAADLTLNYMLTNANMMMLVHGDPALHFKKNVEATMVEYQKRLAKDIAPGMLSNSDWKLEGTEYSGKQTYNVIYVSDPKVQFQLEGLIVKFPKYAEIDTITDAQEFTTVEEHLDVLFGYGRISDKLYKSLKDKINSVKNTENKYYTLSEEERKVVLQPIKPVQVMKIRKDGVSRIVYIKSSSIPMLPEYTAGTQFEDVRLMMEKGNIQRLAFKSATKLGIKNSVNLWKSDGSINTSIDLSKYADELNRSNFMIQQDVPYDPTKHEIRLVTQMNKLLFSGLLESEFNFNGSKLNGEEFRTLKEDVRIKLLEQNEEVLNDKLGIEKEGDTFIITDLNKVKDTLIEEALVKGWNTNDIEGLELNSDKTGFVIPLAFNNSADKIESLLISIINNTLIRSKIEGKSFVQSSSIGLNNKVENWSVDQLKKSGVVFTQKFIDERLSQGKNLDYINVDKEGKVHVAQVLVPFKFFDTKSGELLHLEDFITKEGYLDTEKLPEDLLRLIGARIPNQGHSSQLAIEVVGFTPKSMGDTVVVPAQITVQMGSDFDVDKLYTYMNKYIQNSKGELVKVPLNLLNEDLTLNEKNYEEFVHNNFKNKKTISDLLNPDYEGKYSKKALYKAALEQMYFDIHYNVLTTPEVIEKCLTPLDKPDLEVTGKKYQVAKDKNNYMSHSRQMNDFLSQKAGKDGVGVYSRAVVGLTTIEGKGLILGQLDKEKKLQVKPFTRFAYKTKEGKSNYSLYDFSGKGVSEFDGEKRSKVDNIITQQSGAVDNAKTPVLDMNNLNMVTFNASIAMSALSDSNNKALSLDYNSYFLRQQIIKDYIAEMATMSDMLTEEFVANKKQAIIDKLTNKYKTLAGDTRLDLTEYTYTSDELGNMLLDKTPEGNENTENWSLHQLEVLNMFSELDNIGKELSEVFGATSTDSKGLPKSQFEVNALNDRIQNIGQKNYIYGAENIMKNGQNISEVGKIAEYVNQSLKMLDNFLPYNSSIVQNIIKEVENITGKDTSDRVDTDFRKAIFNELKSYIFSNEELGLSSKRDELLLDKVDENKEFIHKSLAKRVEEAKQTWGNNNMFLRMLSTKVSDKPGKTPSLIEYKAAVADRLDINEVISGFIDMFLSKNSEVRNLAEDLVAYAYLSGGIQGANEYLKLIPISYLRTIPFAAKLEELNNSLYGADKVDTSIFIEQLAQHQPKYFKKLGDIDTKKSEVEIDIEKNSNLLIEKYDPSQGKNIQEMPTFVSARDTKSNKWYTYRLEQIKNGKATYSKLDILGGTNMKNNYLKEYQFDVQSARSLFEENKLGKMEEIKQNIVGSKVVDSTSPIKNDYNLVNTQVLSYISEDFDNNAKEVASKFTVDEFKVLNDVLLNNPKLNLSSVKVELDYRLNEPGRYFHAENTIKINPKQIHIYLRDENLATNTYNIERIISHELLHAITVDKLWSVLNYDKNTGVYNIDKAKSANNPDILAITQSLMFAYNKALEGLTEEERSLIPKIKKGEINSTKYQKDMYYGFSNIMEFVAETFTSKEFRERINQIEYKGDKTIWDRIKNLLGKLYDLFITKSKLDIRQNTVLSQTINDTLDLIGFEENNKYDNVSFEGESKENMESVDTLFIGEPNLSLETSVTEWLKTLPLSERRDMAEMIRQGIFKCS